MVHFAEVAQVFKIAAGTGQFACAVWLLIRYPRTRVIIAFAVAFGTTGVAFAVWNFARPGARTPHTFALEARGLLDWVAVVALMLFALFCLRTVENRHRLRLLVIPLLIAAPMLVSDILKARAYHLDLMAFGGLAMYVTTAFVLALLASAFSAHSSIDLRNGAALLAAVLAVNYADHVGASIIPTFNSAHPTIQLGGMHWEAPADVAIELSGTLIILGLWLWNARGSAIPRITVISMVVSLAAGVLVRVIAGNYRVVQESGFFGLGLFAGTAILMYGMARGFIGQPIVWSARDVR